MSIKDHKNLIGNIVIIISIIVVIVSAYMVTSLQHDKMYNTDNLDWNGMHIILIEGMTVVEQTDDYLKLTGGYGRHDVEIKKTNDLSRYNDLIGNSKSNAKVDFNDTHKLIYATGNGSHSANCMFIVPKDAIDNSSVKKINGNPTIYEITCPDKDFLLSFVMSIKPATNSSSKGVQYV